ncbi:amino acid ABC transporter permease [Desulfobacter sp.]|uniref:amino acid ABC transporter permease n=1 Tax=Desulfobacter sp. TaxID=2294 RepID=UPI00257E7487|nr:amino acid ABC transporter permease [Desulfobacter sp.]
MAVVPIDHEAIKNIKPPVNQRGIIGWFKENLFNGIFNSVLTLIILTFILKFLPPFIQWAFFKASWFTNPDVCKQCEGACWSVVFKNLRFIIFGFYPHDIHWRPFAAMMILFLLLFFSSKRRFWTKKLAYAWPVGLVAMGALMKGGILGLAPVDSMKWGGLPLTLLLSIFGLTSAYPLGVILALGRVSKMPLIRLMSVAYIELIRGVPLISLLFMSSIIFPLFLPEGITINNILRAQVAIILFTAAYVAEVVRGGLQAMPKGQFEAADAIGLNYAQTMRLIILPQALKIVIPPTVSVLISAFKDTSLVVIIALFDFLMTAKNVIQNPQWMGFSTEMYLFVSLIYFLGCFSMSNFSRKLERELDTDKR